MLRYFAIICGIAAALHARPGADDLMHARLLPAVVVVCMVIVIGWSGTAIIAGGVLLAMHIDLTGSGFFESLLAPLLLMLDLLVFIYWAWRAGLLRGGDGGMSGGYDGFDGFDGGGE